MCLVLELAAADAVLGAVPGIALGVGLDAERAPDQVKASGGVAALGLAARQLTDHAAYIA